MTPTEYLVWFVVMAVAIITILVVGTLAAADVIHVGRRSAPGPEHRLRPAETPVNGVAGHHTGWS